MKVGMLFFIKMFLLYKLQDKRHAINNAANIAPSR